MNAYEEVAGIGLDAGSSGESLLGVWTGREDSPQIENVKAARRLLADGLREQTEDERRFSYTAEGRKEQREKRWRPVLKKLGDLADKVRATKIEDQSRAFHAEEAALRQLAPDYSTNSSLVHIDLALAQLMRLSDGQGKNVVVGMATEVGAIAPEVGDLAAAIVRLPAVLSGVSNEQRSTVRAALAGGNRMRIVVQEGADAMAIVLHVARRMMIESGFGIPHVVAIHERLGNLLATGSMEPGYSGRADGELKPVYDAVSDKAAPALKVAGHDDSDAGYSKAAVA